jgi:Putative peptidoglycan binding domain
MNYRKIHIPAAFSLALVIFPFCVHAATLTWTIDGGEGVWDPQTIPMDAVITDISASMTGVPQGSFMDYCVDKWRDSDPVQYPGIIGGFSEFACWNASFAASSGDWHMDTDLSATPLYIPAGTSLDCGGHLSLPPNQTTGVVNTCTITYQPYVPGTPRYQVFRIPYIDQGIGQMNGFTSSYVPSYYMASDANHPLHVVGVIPYTAFSGSMQNCIQQLHQGGALVQQYCIPAQTNDGTINYQSLGLQSFDWSVPYPDLIDATCSSDPTTWYGCADYLIVQIPPDLASTGPESVFRDYNNVPQNYLQNYCQQRQNFQIENLASVVCPDGNGGATCDAQTAINDCMALFTEASCVATDSCFTKPDDAQCVSNTIPATMTAGNSVPVSVTFANTGTATWMPGNWPAAGSYGMSLSPWNNAWSATNPPPFSPNSAAVPSSIPPGGQAAFSFTLTGPTTPGTYDGQYQMLHQGTAWFGQMCGPANITVNPAPPSPALSLTMSSDAANNTVPYDGSTTLHWSAANASYCSIYGPGTPIGTPGPTVSGSASTGSLTQTTTYSMNCNDEAGNNQGTSITIAVSSPPTPQPTCTFNGTTIPNGSSQTFYLSPSAPYGSQCVGESRTCSNGTLSGSNAYTSCIVASAPPSSAGGGPVASSGGTLISNVTPAPATTTSPTSVPVPLHVIVPALAASTTSSAPSPCPVLSHNLLPGSSGTDVRSLQRFLTWAYSNFFQAYVTGYFGPITESAVKQWQREHGIVSSGTPVSTGWGAVGPRTRAAIAAACDASPTAATSTPAN